MSKIEFKPLTDDSLFKETFGREKNILFLERFLEIFFGLPKGSLRGKITVKMETTLEKTKDGDKNCRGDILIYMDDKIINLELYSTFDDEALSKVIFYGERISGSLLDVGEKYKKAKKFISINIIDNVKVKVHKEWQSKYRFRYLEHELTDKMEIQFLRLDKVRHIPYTVGESELVTLLRFIGAETKEERERYAKEGGEYLMSVNYFLNGFMDDEFSNTMFTMENKIKETGIAEGRIEGKKEEKLKIAKSMLEETPELGISKISKITGLSEKTIEMLKEEK